MKVRLTKISESDKESKNIIICRHLRDFLFQFLRQFHDGQKSSILTIGVYAPLKSEVQWQGILKECKFLKTAYPFFTGPGQMVFKESTPEELVVGKEFGVEIFAPLESTPEVTPDICLIPGLAFSKSRERLGRGKGFYDRYLENFSGIKIGLAYGEQLVTHVPTDDHDQLLDKLITDFGVY